MENIGGYSSTNQGRDTPDPAEGVSKQAPLQSSDSNCKKVNNGGPQADSATGRLGREPRILADLLSKPRTMSLDRTIRENNRMPELFWTSGKAGQQGPAAPQPGPGVDQAETPKGEDLEKEAKLIERRSVRTPRTPPMRRAGMGTPTQFGFVEGEGKERPPKDSSPEEFASVCAGQRKRKPQGNRECNIQAEVTYLREALEETARTIGELQVLVNESTNTKKEIKTKTAKLCNLAAKISSERIKALLSKVETGEAGGKRVAREVEATNKPRRSYTKTVIKEGNPITTTGREVDLVVWRTPEDPKMETGIQKLFKDRYGELDSTEGGISHIKTTTCAIRRDKEEMATRHIFSIDCDKAEEVNRERLQEVVNNLKANNRTKVAMAWEDLKNTESMRDMLEDVLTGTNITGTLHVPFIKKTTEQTPGRLQAKKYGNEAIIVKAKTQGTYASLLREVKDQVTQQGLTEEIQTVRETRNGDLIITMKEAGNTTKMRGALSEKLGKENVRARTAMSDKVVFHIKGLDALTTEEEIREAIGIVTKADIAEVKVTGLRPGFAGTQTATASVDKTTADILRQSSSIRIGLPKCHIRERTNVTTCYKCWATNHITSACSGKDRSKACRKCTQEGHLQRDCPNKSKCVNCECEGHATNTTACPAFRRLLKDPKGGTRTGQPDGQTGWWKSPRRKGGRRGEAQRTPRTPRTPITGKEMGNEMVREEGVITINNAQ